MLRKISAAVFSVGLAAPLFSTSASAHISLEKGGTHLSRYGDGQTDIKDPPCGHLNGARGTHIYTYAPGQTIDVALVEYIPHPSYFRVAFDQDGDDGFKDPASIDPIDPTRKCPDGPGDHCGPSDYYNTPEVLPGMDDLYPHIPTAADLTNPPKYTFHVTLPNVECDNCTLQFIQVMEDDTFHGPYDPTPGVGVPDVYHQCIDIVLKTGAGDGGTATGDGGTTTGSHVSTGTGGPTGPSGAAGSASSNDSGGCSIATGMPHGGTRAPWALLALAALFGMRKRRR